MHGSLSLPFFIRMSDALTLRHAAMLEVYREKQGAEQERAGILMRSYSHTVCSDRREGLIPHTTACKHMSVYDGFLLLQHCIPPA